MVFRPSKPNLILLEDWRPKPKVQNDCSSQTSWEAAKGDSNSNASDNTYLEGCWLVTRIVRAEGKKPKEKKENWNWSRPPIASALRVCLRGALINNHVGISKYASGIYMKITSACPNRLRILSLSLGCSHYRSLFISIALLKCPPHISPLCTLSTLPRQSSLDSSFSALTSSRQDSSFRASAQRFSKDSVLELDSASVLEISQQIK